MRVYKSNQIGKMFLSPYIRTVVEMDNLIIYQTIFAYKVSLKCTNDFAKMFLETVSKGIDEKDLLNMLSGIMDYQEATTLINTWLQMGVLE